MSSRAQVPQASDLNTSLLMSNGNGISESEYEQFVATAWNACVLHLSHSCVTIVDYDYSLDRSTISTYGLTAAAGMLVHRLDVCSAKMVLMPYTVLYIYDFVLTFERQYSFVRNRRKSGPIVLYVILNLAAFGSVILLPVSSLVPGCKVCAAIN